MAPTPRCCSRRPWSTAGPTLGVLAAGQVVGVIDDLPTVEELIERIMAEAEAVLTRLTST